MKIKPLLDKVVIKELKPETITRSGIVLPQSAQEKSQLAEVIAVGTGGYDNGELIKMQVEVGNRVLFSQFAGNEFKLEGTTYKILSQYDIMAIVED
jgi:chaperonin GroES